jgi:hypothetical protein
MLQMLDQVSDPIGRLVVPARRRDVKALAVVESQGKKIGEGAHPFAEKSKLSPCFPKGRRRAGRS